MVRVDVDFTGGGVIVSALSTVGDVFVGAEFSAPQDGPPLESRWSRRPTQGPHRLSHHAPSSINVESSSRERNTGELLLHFKPFQAFTLDMITKMRLVEWLSFLTRRVRVSPFRQLQRWGDFLATICTMLGYRRRDSVKVSKVKGHADQFMVADGSVWQDDLEGTPSLRKYCEATHSYFGINFQIPDANVWAGAINYFRNSFGCVTCVIDFPHNVLMVV